MALNANLLSDNVGRAAEAALPEFIADNCDLRVCATAEIFILGSEKSAQERKCTKFGVAIACNREYAIL